MEENFRLHCKGTVSFGMARVVSFFLGFGGTCFAYQLLHDRLKYHTDTIVDMLEDGQSKFPNIEKKDKVTSSGENRLNLEVSPIEKIFAPIREDLTFAVKTKIDKVIRDTHREVKEVMEER